MVLDTHALLWWCLDPAKLSRRTAKLWRQAEQGVAYVSTIRAWELGVKIHKGLLELGMGIGDFVARTREMGMIEWVPVSTAIWLDALALEWDHRDPADRVIVATALRQRLPLLTADRQIQAWGRCPVAW